MPAIIDIGSNSVRLMMPSGEKTVITTKLGEGLSAAGKLQPNAMDRTLSAIGNLRTKAVSAGAEVEAFATEAVRSADNGAEFVSAVRKLGIPVRVLSGAEEALCGYLGATAGLGGVVLDVGGASTEVIVGKGDCVGFSVSIPIGIVRARDMFGQDYSALSAYVSRLLADVKMQASAEEVIAIGGTAISAAAIDSGKVYDRKNTDGRVMNRSTIEGMFKRLSAMTNEQRLAVPGLAESRADTICGGLIIILTVMDALGAIRIRTSERDNLEGYVMAMQKAPGTPKNS